MDVKAKPKLDTVVVATTNFFNQWLGPNSRWQSLPQPFSAGEVALRLNRDFDRNKLFTKPSYRKQFKADYQKKVGRQSLAS